MALLDGTNVPDVDIDFSDIESKYHISFDEALDNTIVVDCVPVINKSKLEKLQAKMAKEFNKKGVTVRAEDIFMPWDESTGKSKGYVFIDFRTTAEASAAVNTMDGHPFDSKHTFIVNLFTDIERLSNVDESYSEPKAEEYKPREYLRAWLGDPKGRDQYATYRGDEAVIHWHGKPSQCEVAYEKPPSEGKWTELYVSWSPQGTYFATLLRRGVRLWGGPTFKPQEKFAHPLVMMIDFSPCENYLVTWSHDPIAVPHDALQGPRYFSPDDVGNQIAVWNVKTGDLLRTFPAVHYDNEDPSGKQKMPWPALKWSPDDKYVARITPRQHISVYELPGMRLQCMKSIKIEGVVDYEWCPLGERDREEAEKDSGVNGKGAKKPRENMLAYWTPEVANQPARVTLMSFPGRTILRQKNLFNVTECKLHWQNQGDFLCVRVDRHTKTKKTLFCNLEMFSVREKDYPVEVVELKDTVLDFSWEPSGERFMIISSNDPNVGNTGSGITIKTDVSIYQLHRGKNDFRLLRTLPSTTSNAVRWSPRGRFVVLATMGSASKSELQFWDLNFNEDIGRKEGSKEEWGAGIQHLGTADHYGVTDVEWDPSGRYLATSASAWKHTLENGYAIWDFRGQELEKHIVDRFKQFLWRPRPHTLLDKERRSQIRKNLREYSRQFEQEDARLESNVSAELIAHRKRLVDEWNAWRKRCREEIATAGSHVNRKDRRKEEGTEEIEVWIEELIEEVEELVVE